MSFRSIGQGINEALFGKDCELCKKQGVTCHDTGLLDDAPANTGETVIYVGGRAAMRTPDKIAECDIIQDKATRREVVKKIKKNAKMLEGSINIFDHKISNY